MLQWLGKLDGPGHRNEILMDVFLLPFILSVRAAISFLLLLQVSFTRSNIIWFIYYLLQSSYSGIYQVIQWIGFLLWIFITGYSGRFWYLILWCIFIMPITLFTFFWHIYNFGPKHHKRSLFDILSNPVPGIEFDGRLGESDEFNLLKRWRFNHKVVARQIAQSKQLSSKSTTRSAVSMIHDCPMAFTLIQQLQNFMDTNPTLLSMILHQKRRFSIQNKACWWHYILLSATSHVPKLYTQSYHDNLQMDLYHHYWYLC